MSDEFTVVNGPIADQRPIPGVNAAVYVQPTDFLAPGDLKSEDIQGITIDSSSTDGRCVGFPFLWPGLVMARVTGTKLYVPYNPSGHDGSQYAIGILYDQVRLTLPLTGTPINAAGKLIQNHGCVLSACYVNALAGAPDEACRIMLSLVGVRDWPPQAP